MSAPTIPALGDATLFPYAPDGQFPVVVEEEWLTDIQAGASGAEVRQACRSKGVRALTFTAAFLKETELLAFRDRWLNAAAALRYLVPLWSEFAIVTGLAGAVVTCDTTLRDFVAGGLAMLYHFDATGTDDAFELVTVQSFTSTTATLTASPTGTFPLDGTSALIPVMAGWVDPPAVDELAIVAERMTLTFREELPAIAGIDPTITEDATPAASSIALSTLESGYGFASTQMVWRAIVKDAAGDIIPLAPVTWSIVPDAPTDPGVRLTVSPDEQEARLELEKGLLTTGSHTLTAQSGSASVSLGITTFI